MFSNIFKNRENTKISSHFNLTIQQLSKFESDNQKANLRSHIISPINASVCISNFYITISLSQLKKLTIIPQYQLVPIHMQSLTTISKMSFYSWFDQIRILSGLHIALICYRHTSRYYKFSSKPLQ